MKCTYTVCKPVWETRVRTLQLHDLQAGLGDLHRRTTATRSASRCTRPRREIHYTVCKPCRDCTKNYCYTVCKPVYETSTQELLLHGLQAGLREDCYTVAAGTRLRVATPSASRCGRPATKNYCYTVCKPVYETCARTTATRSASRSTRPARRSLLHGLQAGLRDLRAGLPLHDLQAGVGDLHEELCYTVCKPVYETCEREECYTVCKPVHYTQDGAVLLRPLGDAAGGVLRAPACSRLLRRLRLLLPGRAAAACGFRRSARSRSTA